MSNVPTYPADPLNEDTMHNLDMRTARGLAEAILESDRPRVLRDMLDDLARSADTAELLLRKDYPGEARSLRTKVAEARYILAKT